MAGSAHEGGFSSGLQPAVSERRERLRVKNTLPWFPFYVADFMGARMRLLSRELRAVHLELAALMWQSEDCRLPDNDAAVANLLAVNPRTWRCKWRPALLDDAATRLYEKTADGYFHWPWLTQQREDIGQRSRNRSEAAIRRWARDGRDDDAPTMPQAPAQPDMPRAERAVADLFNSMPAGEVVATMVLKDGSLYHVHEREVLLYEKLYPSVNVRQELRSLEGWCRANPAKRKTRARAEAFITNALARKTERMGGEAAAAAPTRNFDSGRHHHLTLVPAAAPEVAQSRLARLKERAGGGQ